MFFEVVFVSFYCPVCSSCSPASDNRLFWGRSVTPRTPIFEEGLNALARWTGDGLLGEFFDAYACLFYYWERFGCCVECEFSDIPLRELSCYPDCDFY